MNKVVHAYMSGALTNLSSALVIPPCCQSNGQLRDQLEQMKRQYKFDILAKEIEKEQKAHYERIADEACKPLDVELYLPHRHSDPEHNADIASETVHYVDRLRVTSSSFVIACGDIPSFGVGQELEIATQAGIPVIAYKHVRTRTSRMFLGNPILCEDTYRGLAPDEDSEKVIEYETEKELFGKLRRRIQFLRDYLADATRPVHKGDDFDCFASRLRYLVEQTGHLDERTVAAVLGVPGTFAAFLLKNPDQLAGHFLAAMPDMVSDFDSIRRRRYDFDKFTNPSLTTLRHLATALNSSVAELIGETGKISELEEALLNYCILDHDTSSREYLAIRKGVPPGLQHARLRQYVAEKIRELRRK